MGAQQWEMETPSRIQNNIYKNTLNYPDRASMKAYLKFEWMYQLRQILRKFPSTNFYFINRKEYLEGNPFLRWYFDQSNIKCGIYADLQRWITGGRDDIKWKTLLSLCATSINFVDLTHFHSYFLCKSLRVTVWAYVLVVIGGTFRIYFGPRTQELDATRIASEHKYGIFPVKGVVYATFTLAFVQSHGF